MLTILSDCVAIIFFYMTTIFIIASMKKDNSIVDIAWGIGFIIVSLFTLLKTNLYLPIQILTTILIMIWGLRLSTHIYLQNKGKAEDPRYEKWRKQWGKWFALRSYFQIFLLQGIILLIIVFPVILVNTSKTYAPNMYCYSIGLIFWIVGFLFESIGDFQLSQFIKDPANKGKIMDSGLWKYTRHPNYFGEVCMWWGIFIIGYQVPLGYMGVISPILITYLLLFVSGIPMTEKLLAHSQAFQEYKKRTSAFIPWPPKKGNQ